MNLSQLAAERYTTKAYDPTRKVPQAAIDQLTHLLQHAPSSVNSQPWHFIIAGSEQGKARIAAGATGPYAYNEPKIRNASHVVVLCSRTDMSDSHLEAVLAQEDANGRFASPEARATQDKTRRSYVDLHRYERKDLQHWMEKQTYLALGMLLLGAASLGIDATPMEGFDARALDAELGLRELGFTSVVLVSLGYRADSDFNAGLPKSRLPAGHVITLL